jgi:hypothetical protein
LIKSRFLHDKFPEMRWKNTVNHRVADAQQVMNYIFCGYDTILLDRSINRNLKELKKIRKAVDYYNKKHKPAKKIITSLLVKEGCLYSCPFKKEHDSMGEYIGGLYFDKLSKLTCDNWRFTESYGCLPRNAIDLVVAGKETFNEFAELNDIFKLSGRFSQFNFSPGDVGRKKSCWLFETQNKSRFDYSQGGARETIYSNSLSDVIDDNIMPLQSWVLGWVDPDLVGDDYKNKLEILEEMPDFWKTDKGKRLEKILKNCRSQCWECHECEKAFETPQFDSALEIRADSKV